MNRVVLSYIGVHQIFQLALAAEEMGELEALHCSMIDRPGKWGAVVGARLRVPSLRPLGSDSLPADKLIECPWPLLSHRLGQRLIPWHQSDHLFSNAWFDAVIAQRLRASPAAVFVGVETCALQSMRVAKVRGMKCVLDCAGMPHRFLHATARAAAVELGMQPPDEVTSVAMDRRKREELDLADVVVCCSEFQAQQLVAETGVAAERIRVIPLWVDATFWRLPERQVGTPLEPLKVIYAGGVSLQKGVPFLIEAARQLGDQIQLTLVGRPSAEITARLVNLPSNTIHRPYVPRSELRRLYAEQDLLVMPSLGDSFGFVAMEAMAAGLPVIVSSHTGAPVPAPEWRVPTASVDALCQRLRHYLQAREALIEDGKTAAAFATQWTPERYRGQVQELLAATLV